MEKHYCIYCRNNEIIYQPSENALDAGQNRLYKCSSCGILCTKADLEAEEDKRELQKYSPNGSTSNSLLSETETLSAAWKLMQSQQWEKALVTLGQYDSPLTHPAEFLICRNICQAAPLLKCSESELETRYQKLDILINNINCLNYYMPDDGKQADFAVLTMICRALMLLGSQPTVSLSKYEAKTVIDHTNYKRVMILCSCADFLDMKASGNDKNSTEYLKMAAELLHKCLEMCQEPPGTLLPCTMEEFLELPRLERQQITSKILQLNAEICRRDPNFTPKEPLPEPKLIPTKIWFSYLAVCIVFGLTAIFLTCFSPFLYFGESKTMYKFARFITDMTPHAILRYCRIDINNYNDIVMWSLVVVGFVIFLFLYILKDLLVHHYQNKRCR